MSAELHLPASTTKATFYALFVLALALIAFPASVQAQSDTDVRAFEELLLSWPQLASGADVQHWRHDSIGLCSLRSVGIACSAIGQVSEINLSGQNLRGIIPNAIGKFPGLTALDLSQNELEGSLPLSIAQLSHLERLNLQGNPLSGPLPHFMTAFPALRSINLDDTLLEVCTLPQWAKQSLIRSSLESSCNQHLQASLSSRDVSQAMAPDTPLAPGAVPLEPLSAPTAAPSTPLAAPVESPISTPAAPVTAPQTTPVSSPTVAATPTASTPTAGPTTTTAPATPATPATPPTAAPTSPSAASPSPSAPATKKSSLSGPSIAGIVVGAIILALILALVLFFVVADPANRKQPASAEEAATDMGSPRTYRGADSFRNESKMSIASQPDVSKNTQSRDPSDNSAEAASDSSDDYSDDS